VLRGLAGDLQGERLYPAAGELGEEPAEDLGQRQVRPDRARGLTFARLRLLKTEETLP
jgi:hypothetical protein